jgi:ribosome-binding ATPase YchF (GTP1/OBG family)
MVRCFNDPEVIHVDGSIDPVRDLRVIHNELVPIYPQCLTGAYPQCLACTYPQ